MAVGTKRPGGTLSAHPRAWYLETTILTRLRYYSLALVSSLWITIVIGMMSLSAERDLPNRSKLDRSGRCRELHASGTVQRNGAESGRRSQRTDQCRHLRHLFQFHKLWVTPHAISWSLCKPFFTQSFHQERDLWRSEMQLLREPRCDGRRLRNQFWCRLLDASSNVFVIHVWAFGLICPLKLAQSAEFVG